jgi:hypothetical protein
MNRQFHSLLFCLIFTLPTAAWAEGLIYQLPPDGEWARYQFDGIFGSGTLTISSVGNKQVAGERCRWIEITQESRHGEKKPLRMTARVLVPEAHLGYGKEPLKHVVEAWIVNPFAAKSPQRIDDPAGKGAGYMNSLEQFLHGPYAEPQKLPSTTVESKLGKLECTGFKIIETAKKDDDPLNFKGGYTQTKTYTIRLHKSAPFGVVTYDADLKVAGVERTVSLPTKLALLEVGRDAKSAIPEADQPPPTGLTAKEVLDRVAKTYLECKSYSDSGTFTTVHGPADKRRTMEKTYKLALVRPDRFRFEFVDNVLGATYVFWRSGEELKYFKGQEGEAEQTPKSFKAVAEGASAFYPLTTVNPVTLLFPEETGQSLVNLKSLRRLEDAMLDKANCHCIEGRGGVLAIDPVTLWIDAKTFLVRRIDHVPMNGSRYRPEITILCNPVIDGDVPDAALVFVTPYEESKLLGEWSDKLSDLSRIKYEFQPKGMFTCQFFGLPLNGKPGELEIDGKGTWKYDSQAGTITIEYASLNKLNGTTKQVQQTLRLNRFNLSKADELKINGYTFVRKKP